MEIDAKLIKRAKEKLGDENALWMAELLKVEKFDEYNLKACCPFHAEDTPSFIYDKKRFRFHCFGCSKSVDIIDTLIYTGMTYAQACQELFKRADIQYNFNMIGVKALGREYRYPHNEQDADLDKTIKYLGSRGISERVIRAAGIQQDKYGNMAFRYMDTNDVLTMVKYRPSGEVRKGENKMWAQPGSDTKPLLYNMNRVNASAPLLICEGEIDCLSAIEAGYINAVSIPMGAGNAHWIETNWEWLDSFESIILCGDNDKPGQDFMRDAAFRLGLWRTKFVDLPPTYNNEYGETLINKDINDTLIHYGADKVMECIAKAKDAPVDSVADFADIEDVNLDEQDGIYFGIGEIDRAISKLNYGSFNILSGINGCVDLNMQYFNGTRWKYINEYAEGDKVLVYGEDGTAWLEYPERYICAPCGEMYQFQSFGVNQVVTPEHTMVYRTPSGKLCLTSAEQARQVHNTEKGGFRGAFINTFDNIPEQEYSELSDAELELVAAAMMAEERSESLKDGSVLVRAPKYEHTSRIMRYIGEAGIQYSVIIYKGKNSVRFIPPHNIRRACDDLYRLSKRQYGVFLDALTFWSKQFYGDRGNLTLYTPRRDDADLLQFVCATQGVATRVGIEAVKDEYGCPAYLYKVAALTNSINGKMALGRPVTKVVPADGNKYCFTVSTGMWVSRRMGIINVTGNSGKSSFLSQAVCQCLEQGRDAWLYSMELPNYMAKSWIQHVLAGAHHLEAKEDARGRKYWNVPDDVKKQISDHYRGRLYVYKDGMSNKADDIISSMEASARKYGCKLFVLDNLTAINLGVSGDEKWDKQNEFVTRLINFAKKYNVVVLLVVHPRKLDMMRKLSKMDVQGSGGIVDLAHRAFSLYRVPPKEKEGVRSLRGDGWKIPPEPHDVILGIMKDRFTGCENTEIGLFFHRPSMRFFTTEEELNYCYSWDKIGVDKAQWVHPPQLREVETPFD